MPSRITPDGYTRLQLHDPCLECNACGAVVVSPGRHDQWHDGLIARLAEIGNAKVSVDSGLAQIRKRLA